jgi:hypothetical protein
MKTRIIVLACIAALAAGVSARDRVHGSIVVTPKGVALFNVTSGRDAQGDFFRLGDISYDRNPDPLFTDIVFSFSKGSSGCMADDTGRYGVSYAQYDTAKDEGTAGGSAALFYKREHRIDIMPRENLWLSSHGDLGSFSIEMRVCPLIAKEGAVLFSRIGYLSGARNGLEIKIRNGRMTAFFYGVFSDKEGHRSDNVISARTRLAEKKWQHYLLSYDRVTGKLSQVIDGREESSVFMTETGQPDEGALSPSFSGSDMPKTVLAKNYSGYLDEFRISYRSYDELKQTSDLATKRYRELRMAGRTPINKEGVMTSDVGVFDTTGTRVNLFAWDGKYGGDTFSWFEVRTSDVKFLRDDTRLKWYRIANNQRDMWKVITDDGELRGKYYQWRAHLISSPDGDNSPEIRNIRLSYELDAAPDVPQSVEVMKTGDRTVVLRWRKNVEFDLCGYKIYYGVRPGRYDGVLRRVNGKVLANDLSSANYMAVEISNSLIEENRELDSGGVLEYPEMKNSVLYYFAVSAYDSYKPDTQFNHESKISSPVSGRPWAGSEIQ